MSEEAKAYELSIEQLLDMVVEENASDLHLSVDIPPVLRINGKLNHVDTPALAPADTQRFMEAIAPQEHRDELKDRGGSDFGFSFGEKARFRVSIYMERGNVSLALRLIPSTILTLEQIGLPAQMKDLLFKPRGLVLVTGPTGSGKTTTLASMVNIINEERDVHIITVEDPIEYYHPHKHSIVTQREIGKDVPNFGEAIRRGLRQDPDVILVGEMRDLETMEAAITAAETGHLVFATLHTTGAARTVDRIVDAFPMNQQEQIRTQLASSIVAVISQLLLPRQDQPGRVAAFEIMVATSSIRALIRDSKTFRITSDIQTGGKWGMVTLDAHLTALYERGQISYEDLITKCQEPESVAEKLAGTGKKRR
ncbi:MAG: type IV pilus twitching motility protein PilT [Verrucomicrobia bacterium]|nr:type IV pilus twitching motility protein PilT [Verrucomicrobiota bacterium]